MKVTIDDNLKGKELYSFLIENKSQLIAQKRALLKHSDPVYSVPDFFNVKGGDVTKTEIGSIPENASSIRVKVVANTAYWCDSQMDVLLPDCWKRSIKERKGMIPHLHDHIHTIDAEVGEVANIYSQEISLTELGLNKTGTTQSLIFETDIKKAYNERVFNKYRAGKVKQHSIGLQYVKIELAVNDEESEKEYDFWNKYAPLVINQEVISEKGFFWVVSEIKLLENSAVLFGSNTITPTLSVGAKQDDNAETDTILHPSPDIEEQPSETSKAFNIEQIFKNIQIQSK